MKSFISIDIGTSSIKGSLISDEGKLETWDRIGLLDQPGADLDCWKPSIWVTAAAELIKKLLKGSGVHGGIVISGNGPTIVPVKKDGSADTAVMWLDKKSSRGNMLSYYLHKIKWYQDTFPEKQNDISFFLGCPEYINYLLCGEALMVSPWSEFDQYIWTGSEAEKIKTDKALLPPVVRSGEQIGSVCRKAAQTFGLPEGLPVFASGSDFHAALIGTGAVKPGTTCDRAGTSEGINYCSPRMISSARLRPLPHAVPGLYNIAGILESTGRIFQWFRTITTQEDVPYEKMLEEICSLPFDRHIPSFFPSTHIHEIWQFSNALFTDLEPVQTEVEMGRAVVEAIGFAVRDLILTLEDEKCPVDTLTVSGGQGRNSRWNQMKADITGKEIHVPHIIDAELLGNVCIALFGLGEYASLVEAAECLVKIEKTFVPDREMHNVFDERYRIYREKCDNLLSKFHS